MIIKIFRYISLLYLLFPPFVYGMAEFSPIMAACEQTEFGRLSSVNDGALVEEFKIGCKNSSTLDRVIETQLQTIAADSQGAGMLRVMAAMINPYVKWQIPWKLLLI